MAPLLHTLQSNETLRSAARFALIGILGTLVDFTLFLLLHLGLGLPAILANTLSYSAGIVNNYVFHRGWTFAYRSPKPHARQLPRFALVSLSALLLNNLVVLALTPGMNAFLDPGASALAVKLCATGLGLGWNFYANHRWTFR